MKTQSKALCAVLLSVLPATVSAQDFSGAATLGFGRSSVSGGGGDANIPTLDATGLVDFNNGVFLGLVGKLSDVNASDASADVRMMDLGAAGTYQFNSGATLGGYIDYLDTDATSLGLSVDGSATSYGFTGGFVRDDLGVEFHLGMTDTSPSLGAGVDWVDYGVNLRYVAGANTRVGGHIQRSDISGPGGSLDITSYGIGADHQFGVGWSAFGGLTRASVTGGVDLTTLGIGVGYDLSQNTSLPAQLSLELARSDLDVSGASGDVDSIRLGFSMPLGKRRSVAPLNSVARASMAPRHNALSTLLDSTY